MPVSSPPSRTKTHSSCQTRSLMYFRIKPFLTTCLSPKAIIGEGAPFHHLNLIPAKKKEKRKGAW